MENKWEKRGKVFGGEKVEERKKISKQTNYGEIGEQKKKRWMTACYRKQYIVTENQWHPQNNAHTVT